MQKAQLTCTTYEEQIIRLNEQLSLETIEKQNKGDFYEKKVQDLEERVEIMEEGMYDPEAYYCLERDKVRVVCCNVILVFRNSQSIGRRNAICIINKSKEGLLISSKNSRV